MNVVDCRLIYDNFIRNADITFYASGHPQFPVEYMQDDALTLPWRSRHGTGTGNGNWYIMTSTNRKIDFDEGGAEISITLTNGTYNGQTLCTEIKTRMNAAGGQAYTVTYDEVTAKFTISAPGNFTLRWLTGTNTLVNAALALGFTRAANSTGDKTYTSINRVIHTNASVYFDFGEAKKYDSVALINHNISSAATITVQGADDSAFTTNLVGDSLTHADNNIFKFLAAARTKRYVRIVVTDPTNPDGYIQIGCFVVGKYLAPNRCFGPYSEGEVDETEIEYSPSNNPFVTQERPALVNYELPFSGLNSTAVAGIRAMLKECGVRKAFWLCVDSTAAGTNSYWLKLKETTPPACEQIGYWTWTMIAEERL